MINNTNLAYSIQKNIISVYYKDMVDDPLTEGKTAEDLINLIKETDLPEIKEIQLIKTTVAKVKSKYRVISILRYIANTELEDYTLTMYDTIEEYNKPTKTLIIVKTKYVVVSDDDGLIVIDYVDESESA